MATPVSPGNNIDIGAIATAVASALTQALSGATAQGPVGPQARATGGPGSATPSGPAAGTREAAVQQAAQMNGDSPDLAALETGMDQNHYSQLQKLAQTSIDPQLAYQMIFHQPFSSATPEEQKAFTALYSNTRSTVMKQNTGPADQGDRATGRPNANPSGAPTPGAQVANAAMTRAGVGGDTGAAAPASTTPSAAPGGDQTLNDQPLPTDPAQSTNAANSPTPGGSDANSPGGPDLAAYRYNISNPAQAVRNVLRSLGLMQGGQFGDFLTGEGQPAALQGLFSMSGNAPDEASAIKGAITNRFSGGAEMNPEDLLSKMLSAESNARTTLQGNPGLSSQTAGFGSDAGGLQAAYMAAQNEGSPDMMANDYASTLVGPGHLSPGSGGLLANFLARIMQSRNDAGGATPYSGLGYLSSLMGHQGQ